MTPSPAITRMASEIGRTSTTTAGSGRSGSGGWGVAFARHQQADALARLRVITANHLAQNVVWGFEEYFHGESGQSFGTPGMAYTATVLLLTDTESMTNALATPDAA